MKKFISIFVFFMIATLFTACNPKKTETVKTDDKNAIDEAMFEQATAVTKQTQFESFFLVSETAVRLETIGTEDIKFTMQINLPGGKNHNMQFSENNDVNDATVGSTENAYADQYETIADASTLQGQLSANVSTRLGFYVTGGKIVEVISANTGKTLWQASTELAKM